ncbi:hypothetical protein DY000_02027691 [Brassica cretica]|uniref:Protein kinase domain-containing protein n=1 Tax=Brassica cretica TaxID=69181 RepID=A0ABQ7E8V5_BRACR|nr:hypothetical protein DY000_02027691 [Brassica cretica]
MKAAELTLLILVLVGLVSSCESHCGDVEILYPFGIGKGCCLEKSYEIQCRNTTSSGRQIPFLSAIGKEVVYIYLPTEETFLSSQSSDIVHYLTYGLVRVQTPIISAGCLAGGEEFIESIMNFTGTPFFIDDTNSLIAVGCNAKVSLTHIKSNMVGCELICNTSEDQPSNNIPFLDKAGCSSKKLSYRSYEGCTVNRPEEAECDGNGCCQTKNHSFLSSLRCANIKDNGHTSNSIGPQLKCLCDQSNISEITYVHCGCKKGFTGNAYIRDGCQDVNECQTLSYPPCRKGETCVNTQGDYDCVGDKKKPILIGVGSGFGVLVLVGGVWWLRKFLIKRRVTKRKKKFFKRNGGLLLQQELNTKEGNVEKTRIFSSRELEKATENFSQNRVLGHGGQGTVYKGMLLDGRTVAVKKSKVIDEDKLKEFINEVVILSQINHRHIVKLLGCCLETEVPMLVYEFIINGNLFQHIQEESDDYTMVWGMRLRIAVDVAGALSYLHSSASSPIYHRDIKSSNILLDEKYRAKVADFGTSRSVTIDQTHWTTVVSGTVGYVDPEYYRSSQYTEKSDVYSFGAILAELITGDKPVIMVQNTREIVSLADHFRIAMKENRLSNIMDARIKDDCKPEQVMAVANLALKCLSWKGKKRPNMRQAFMELERICTSPEGLQEQNRNNEEGQEEEEEEDVNMINKEVSWSVSVTAPAVCTVASPSSSDAEPLFPRLTW